jgi:putative FmdB family regulatory protein
MPFYEYECSNCKYAAEVLQKISDAPLKKCPSCGKGAFKRLISAPVFRLKGSGWYETDFKSDKEGKRNLAGAEREEAKSDSGAGGADATVKGTVKPEAKTAESAKPDAAPAAGASDAGKSRARTRSASARSTPAKSAAAKRAPAKRPQARSRSGRRGRK